MTTQQTSKPTILLIEDDPLLVKMYNTKFTNEGFQVLIAEDGEVGLKMSLQQKVDFIILDLMLPKLSGLDLLSQLRQNPKGKNIPVVVLSNLAQPEKEKKAKELGVKDFLVKADFTPSQVVDRVKQYSGR